MQKTKTTINGRQLRTILIIEHDRIVGLELQQQLENNGYIIFRPLSLVDTAVFLSNDKPHLIIANSSVKSDSNFISFKKLLTRQQLPIIFLSTDSSATLDSNLNTIGNFTKPFQSADILAFIDNFFIHKKNKK